MTPLNIRKFLSLLLLAALVGCNMPRNQSSPTPNVTQAYETVAARLTEAAMLTPVATEAPAPTAAPSNTPAPSATPGSNATPLALPSPTPTTKACDQAAPGLPNIDVTIPDDTKMQPGQTFTKTWRLQNTGSCAWSKDYSIAVFSGEPMNAPSAILIGQKVEPGESVEISANLVAPSKAGTYTSNWKLRNAAGTWFGIGAGGVSPFWVRIIVEGEAVGTITPTITGTYDPNAPTKTPTATSAYPGPTSSAPPAVQVNGANTLVPEDRLDLDTNQVNTGSDDLAYQLKANGRMQLVPIGGGGIVGYGGSAPAYNDCLKLTVSSNPIVLRNIPVGSYLCYRTGSGRVGWLKVTAWTETSPNLSLQVQTWALP